MNEKKKLIMVLTMILAVVLTVIIGQFISTSKSHSIRKKVDSLYNGNETSIIYIGRKTCGYCQLFNPVIKSLSEKYQFDYHFIDRDKLTNKDLLKVLDIVGIDENNFGTPYLVIAKDGKKIVDQNGYTDEVGLFELLQEAGIIDKDETNPYVASDDNKVVKSFIEVFNSSSKRLVYIGRPTCTFCQKLSPILEEVAKGYNIDYYYINTDEIQSNELAAILLKLGRKTSTFGTPYLAIVQNGEKIGEQPGYVEKEGLIEFFEKNGLVIEKHLNPGEIVNYVFVAQKNDTLLDFISTYVVVLTNRRILLAQKRVLFGYFFIAVTPDLFNDLKVRTGIIWTKIYIDTAKEFIKLSKIQKSASDEIETAITEYMMEEKRKYGLRTVK